MNIPRGVRLKMSKGSMLVLVIGLIMSINTVPSHASDGNKVFMNKCGSCHKNGGEADIFAPTKYAAAQWERFFDKNKHQRKKDISSQLSHSELNTVKEYLMEHAADSEQPEAVGLR
jgi:mono/diheme cytochrome c family protein